MAKQFSGFEQKLFSKELVEKGYKKFVLELEETVPRLKEFDGIYPEEEIKKDTEYVERKERAFNKGEIYQEKKAKILEGIIFLQAELNNWFGENSFTVKTSRFDDMVNGVDMVIEFVDEQGISRLALAVDVSLSQNFDVLTKKILSIRKNLESGKLSNLKYFRSEAEDFKGMKSGLPKVILNTDEKTLDELVELSLNKNNPALKEHPIQLVFLEEMELQLKSFLAVSSPENKEKIIELIELISKVLESKKPALEKNTDQEEFYSNFRAIIKSIFPESD